MQNVGMNSINLNLVDQTVALLHKQFNMPGEPNQITITKTAFARKIRENGISPNIESLPDGDPFAPSECLPYMEEQQSGNTNATFIALFIVMLIVGAQPALGCLFVLIIVYAVWDKQQMIFESQIDYIQVPDGVYLIEMKF